MAFADVTSAWICTSRSISVIYLTRRIQYQSTKKNAKQKREEKLQQREGAELNFFNNLGHIEKMEILNGIADFTDEFRSFLVCH